MLSDEGKAKILKTEMPLHLHNPHTGVRVWPVMKQDSEGNWQISSPDVIKSMLGPRKKKSGKSKPQK
jgi:hypothetical protein